VAVQSDSFSHWLSHSSYWWQSNQAASHTGSVTRHAGRSPIRQLLTLAPPLFILVAVQSDSFSHWPSHSSYWWQSNQAASYTGSATLHTGGSPIRQLLTLAQSLFMLVAVQSGSFSHWPSHSSYWWQSNQAASHTGPATLHTGGSPIRQPVTLAQPLFILVAVQSDTYLDWANHSSYRWQSNQTAVYIEPATLPTDGSPIRHLRRLGQSLFILGAVQSGSLLHYLIF
jgi:hypothetical protein